MKYLSAKPSFSRLTSGCLSSLRLLLVAMLLIGIMLPFSALASAQDFSAGQLKRMGVFLSNFTELRLFDFEAADVLDENNPDRMIYFGVWHNYVNNFKSRIRSCNGQDCKKGDLFIEGKFVKESIKRYFDYDLKTFPSVTDDNRSFLFEKGRYYFYGADGESTYYARVDKAEKTRDGLIKMAGEIYNAEDKRDILGAFTALAKPKKWKGKDTWAIIWLKTRR